MTTVVSLADVVAALERRYPPRLAEEWDHVGLVCGDLAQPVRKVLFALDASAAVVDEAVAWGADLLLTHHPLLFRPVTSVATTTDKGAVIHRLIQAGCALYAAHTNADAARRGVADVLADLIGLSDTQPLVPAPVPAVDKIVVFTPTDATERVVAAMSAAGAGSLGSYTGCHWRTSGTGSFLPLPGSHPAVGQVGERSTLTEDRVEMALPRHARAAVLTALRTAHPYEEPAVDVLELAATPSDEGIGRVGHLAVPTTLAELAQHVAEVLPTTVQGVRVAGEPASLVSRVAVVGGAGDSLFAAASASGADVYITSDLRHHPAMEQRERALLAAAARGEDASRARPFLLDTAHFASESPWLTLAARDLVADLAGGAAPAAPDPHPGSADTSDSGGQAEQTDDAIETRVSALSTDPWSMRLDS